MAFDGFSDDQRKSIEEALEFWDFYIRTETGGVRRTTQPWQWIYFVAYYREREDAEGIEPWLTDHIARYAIDKKGGTYAEGVLEAIYACAAREELQSGYERESDKLTFMTELMPRFLEKQKRLEKEWRDHHNAGSGPLPPAFE